MKVSGAHHTSYTVSDIERSKAFYCDLLGCELLWEREIVEKYFRDIVAFPDSVVKAAELRIPGTDHMLELFEYVHPRGQKQDLNTNNPGNSHLAFIVDDLQAFYQELKAKGVKFKSEPIEVDYGDNTGAWGVYVVDPDGISMELFQPAKKT